MKMIHIETAEKNQRFGFGISGLTSKPAHQMEPRTDMSLSGTHVYISTYKPQDGGEESDSSLRIKASCCFLVVFVRRRRVRHRVIHFKIDVAANAK